MERDPLKPANAERGKAELVLQAAKLALDGGTTTPVEVTPALRLAGNEWVAAVSLDPARLRLALPGRAAPLGCVPPRVDSPNFQVLEQIFSGEGAKGWELVALNEERATFKRRLP